MTGSELDRATRRHQQMVLDEARTYFRDTPLSESVVRAFWAVPRHAFVQRYRAGGSQVWHDVTPDNLAEHLGAIYGPRPLHLYGDDDEHPCSTNSNAAFVLHLIDLLEVKPGHRVLDLGCGSGWTSALMGHLVGPTGRVHGVELIAELAAQAANALKSAGMDHVSVHAGDGANGYAEAAPYDRILFVAGIPDVTRALCDQLTNGGLALFFLRTNGIGAYVMLLEKQGERLRCRESYLAGVVPARGPHFDRKTELPRLEDLPDWTTLEKQLISERPLWFGCKLKDGWFARTSLLCGFLSVVEPTYRVFRSRDAQGNDEELFGLWDPSGPSLVVARDRRLLAYGTPSARDLLLCRMHEWVDLGLPGLDCLHLEIYPPSAKVEVTSGQWLIRGEQSQHLWSVSASGVAA